MLRELIPHAIASRGKLWMMTLVAKEDLWWPERNAVRKHYLDGEYAAEVNAITQQRGAQRFRHETVFASLVIANFLTGAQELLRPNAAGYDQNLQIESLRRLFEMIEALRQWEVQP